MVISSVTTTLSTITSVSSISSLTTTTASTSAINSPIISAPALTEMNKSDTSDGEGTVERAYHQYVSPSPVVEIHHSHESPNVRGALASTPITDSEATLTASENELASTQGITPGQRQDEELEINAGFYTPEETRKWINTQEDNESGQLSTQGITPGQRQEKEDMENSIEDTRKRDLQYSTEEEAENVFKLGFGAFRLFGKKPKKEK